MTTQEGAAFMAEELEVPLVIIGAGAGGMTAAMYAARAGLHTVVLDRGVPGGQMLNTTEVENYPGLESILGSELGLAMARQARKFGPEFVTANVTALERVGDRFRVVTSKVHYLATAIIYATGAQPRLLGIPGEQELRGRGVSYCAVCDGAFFKGERVAVVGGGDAAATEALHLRHLAQRVFVIHRRDRLRARAILANRLLADDKMELVWDTIVTGIVGQEKVEKLRLQNVKSREEGELEVAAVFVAIGLIPNTDLVKDLVELDEAGFIKTNRVMETSVPGLYAVGDVANTPLRQIITSCADGAIAAYYAHDYITGGPYGRSRE